MEAAVRQSEKPNASTRKAPRQRQKANGFTSGYCMGAGGAVDVSLMGNSSIPCAPDACEWKDAGEQLSLQVGEGGVIEAQAMANVEGKIVALKQRFTMAIENGHSVWSRVDDSQGEAPEKRGRV